MTPSILLLTNHAVPSSADAIAKFLMMLCMPPPSPTYTVLPLDIVCINANAHATKAEHLNAGYNLRVSVAVCEDLGGPGAGPGPAGRGSAAWAGKKPTCVFAPCALLCLCWEIVLVAFTAPPLDLPSNTQLLQRMTMMMKMMMRR